MQEVQETGSISGSRRPPGKGNDNPFKCSCPENSVEEPDRIPVHGVVKSQTLLSDWACTYAWGCKESKMTEWIFEYACIECIALIYTVNSRRQCYQFLMWQSYMYQKEIKRRKKFKNNKSNLLFFSRYRYTSFCCTLLCFIDNCVFYKLKFCGNPALNMSVSTIFPATFAHLISRSHFGNSYNISSFFLLYLFWWSVISDLWRYHSDLLKAQMMISIFKQLSIC